MDNEYELRDGTISVLEENRFVTVSPKIAKRRYSCDFSVDYFFCPECNNKVKITYSKDEYNTFADTSLSCERCGKVWSILR